MSKNVEATGLRLRTFDEWRHRRGGGWLSIPAVECRSGGYLWHGLVVNAVVFPRRQIRGLNGPDTARSVANELEAHAALIADCARALGASAWAVAHNASMEQFAVIQLGGGTDVRRIDERTYVDDVLRASDLFIERSGRSPLPDGEASDYSKWHRVALSNRAYLTDIDYIEIRGNVPIAIVEATQANDEDLERTAFAFLSRASLQVAVILALGEGLGVNCMLVSMAPTGRAAVADLDRHVWQFADSIRGNRQQLVARLVRENGESYRVAAGIAVSSLYDDASISSAFRAAVHLDIVDEAELASRLRLSEIAG